MMLFLHTLDGVKVQAGNILNKTLLKIEEMFVFIVVRIEKVHFGDMSYFAKLRSILRS